MSIFIKTLSDIKKMRVAGKLAAEVLEMIVPYIEPGISTGEIDRICSAYITKFQKAVSATLGYHGFPKSICTSINEVVCHGIPNNKIILKEGDIINIDVTVIKNGLYADTSKMFFVGKISAPARCLCQKTQESLYMAISMIKPGIRLYTLGQAIQTFIEKEGFSVVREYCGHGIGRNFHEEPHVFHYYANDGGIVLNSGMALTIEPMVNAGKSCIYTMQDGWTVKTKDNSLSAQYEHTVIVTEDGCEIITLRSDDFFPKRIYHKM